MYLMFHLSLLNTNCRETFWRIGKKCVRNVCGLLLQEVVLSSSKLFLFKTKKKKVYSFIHDYTTEVIIDPKSYESRR